MQLSQKEILIFTHMHLHHSTTDQKCSLIQQIVPGTLLKSLTKNNDKNFQPVGRFGFPGIGGVTGVSEIYILYLYQM